MAKEASALAATNPTTDQFEAMRFLLQHMMKNANPAANGSNAAIPGAIPVGGDGSIADPGTAVTPAPTAKPDEKKPPEKTPKQQTTAPTVPTTLTDSILNMNQVMPVIKAVVPSGIGDGKKVAQAADMMQKIGKIMTLFA